MTEATTHPDDLIQAELEAITGFSDALSALWNEFETRQLFTEPLPSLEREAASELLHQGKPLCLTLPPPDAACCRELLLELLILYARQLPDRADPISGLTDRFQGDDDLCRRFIADMLANDARAVFQFALQNQIPEDLITLLAVHSSRPWRRLAARSLPEGLDLSSWRRGNCPVCGHRPALGHIDDTEGGRTLWCQHCGGTWSFPRLQCFSCGTDDQEQLSILHPENSQRYRCQTCSQCRRFLKEVRIGKPVAEFPFDPFYLATGLLDHMAWEEGYIQDSVLLVPEVRE